MNKHVPDPPVTDLIYQAAKSQATQVMDNLSSTTLQYLDVEAPTIRFRLLEEMSTQTAQFHALLAHIESLGGQP